MVNIFAPQGFDHLELLPTKVITISTECINKTLFKIIPLSIQIYVTSTATNIIQATAQPIL